MNGTTNIVDMYEEILQGKRKRFPNGAWNHKSDAIRLMKYLIEEVLDWSHDDIKKKLTSSTFTKHKLQGMFIAVFDSSPYDAINAVYPGVFKPWEFRSSPKSYWTEETGVHATKWLIEEKLRWSSADIKKGLNFKTFSTNGLGGMLQHVYKGSPSEAVNAIYPGRFKPWEFKMVPHGYWTKETGALAVKWLVEEKLRWSKDKITANFDWSVFHAHGLLSMLTKVFNGSPYAALNAAYPGRFKPWEMKNKVKKYNEDDILS